MAESIRLGLFINTRREKDTHPHLANGKPIDVPEGRYWFSAWFNTNDPDTQKLADELVDRLTKENGKFPIISTTLRSAAPRAAPARSEGWDGEQEPF